jgi:photosystem II stability/assembly factor-like uncharacterized protein
LEATRYSVTETEDVTGISVCGEERCEGDCGNAQTSGDSLFVATKALTGSAANTADVLSYAAGGAFAATAADPFAGGEDIQGIVCFKVGRDSTRVLVARGTTDAGNPAEIAYSDNGGATWTSVDVGSTNAEFVAGAHALFALDRYHIWLGTNTGRIYFSADAGVSWAVQENAVISATAIMGISFIDVLSGFAVFTGGLVAKCSDGEIWSTATTSGNATCTDIHAISSYVAWVTGASGMYFTKDAGVSWTKRNSYATAAVDFMDELFGMAVGSAASGLIYNTINGGYDWSTLPAIANSGLLDVSIVSSKLAYVTGKANGSTGFIAKLLPQS